jgi:hypothetical protein
LLISSLAVSWIELTEATIEPFAGTDATIEGALLSILLPETTLLELLPAPSLAIARRS